MKYLNKFIFLLVVIGLTGCVANGEKFTKGTPEHSKEALIYIYRPSGFIGMAQRPDVKINGQLLGTLSSGGFFTKRITVGSHALMLTGNGNPFHWNYPDRKLHVKLPYSSAYYFRYSPSSSMQGTRTMIHSYDFRQVSENVAIEELENLSPIE